MKIITKEEIELETHLEDWFHIYTDKNISLYKDEKGTYYILSLKE